MPSELNWIPDAERKLREQSANQDAPPRGGDVMTRRSTYHAGGCGVMPAAYVIRPDGPTIGGWGFWCRCGSSRLGGPSEAWARDALADHRRDVHGEGGTA